MDALTLQLEPRSIVGKKVGALRRQGITPTHLYGMGIEPLILQGESPVVQRLVASAGGNIPVTVSIKGEEGSHLTFIREVQRHPLTEAILHVDFYQVPMTEVTQAEVPVHLVGESPAVRLNSGVLFHALHTILVECLPLDVPQAVELDISGLDDFEKALRGSDIDLGDRVTVLTDPNEVIARVNPPRVVVEEVAAVAAEGEEGAPVAEEGDAAAEPAEGEPSKEAV